MRNVMLSLILVLGLGLPALAGPVNVVCTVTDLGWLAEAVGGDDVTVTVLCPGEYDPHFLPARPSLARKLGKADLLCYTGLDLEVGWLPVLMEKARNARVRPGRPGDLDCSQALDQVLEVPTSEVSRAQGDVHPHGNPHYLLDPNLGLAVARLMAQRLGELRPELADAFQRRADALAAELAPRIAAWEQAVADAHPHPVVVYTKQWEYLAHWLGLEILGAVEHRPGITPSPRHVDAVVQQARRQGVDLLVAAPWNHLDAAAKAADRMQARLAVIPAAVASTDQADSYPDMFDQIVARLTTVNER